MPVAPTMPEMIALAQASTAAAVPVAEADPFRPAFHFRAPAQWMNDICGAIQHDGYYHAFYQCNPFSDECDWGSVRACWGHARSSDLVHWEHLPIALAPSQAEGNGQCASGSATHRPDGTPMLFYGHTPEADGRRNGPRQQWGALPLDPELRTWRTLDLGLSPGRSGIPAGIKGGWTDMFVFREAGRTFAIFKESDGLVAEARNAELTEWQVVGRMAGVDGECPNFLKLQDRWLLLRSTYPMTYQVGSFDPERIAFDMDGPHGIVDYAYGLDTPSTEGHPDYCLESPGVRVCRYGAPPEHAANRGFYATSAFADDCGRTLLLAWAGAFRPRGWNCCMSLPRMLSLDAEDRLIQLPIPELRALRREHAGLRDVELSGAPLVVPEITGNMLEVEAKLELGTARSVVLCLRDRDTGRTAVQIDCDGQSVTANGTLVPRPPGGASPALTLHLFFDRSLMELFIDNGRQAVTRVAYPASPSPLRIECSASHGTASIARLDAWQLAGVW